MKSIIICLFFLALNVNAYCGQMNRIQLSDGSVINGEVISYKGGVYTIKTATFGEVKIDAMDVYKIESMNSLSSDSHSSSAPQAKTSMQAQVDSYKQKMMSNPENAALVTELASDPRIQDLANDPAIAEAAKSGDIEALMKNEKFMSAVNSFQGNASIEKLKQKD